MSLEKEVMTPPEGLTYDLTFKIESKAPKVVLYLFKNVGVVVDNSGKNQTEYPEILFGTFEGELGENPDSEALMSQPETLIKNVDMQYVSACIKEVAKDVGTDVFWFYPFGRDNPQDTVGREQARLRLYNRYFNISPTQNNFGYLIKV